MNIIASSLPILPSAMEAYFNGYKPIAKRASALVLTGAQAPVPNVAPPPIQGKVFLLIL